MAMKFVPLDKEKHKSLKVGFNPALPFANKAHISAASINEYAQLCTTMPLVIIKDPKGTYLSVAMLGVESDQNLFLPGDRWEGPHVPLNIIRYPFDARPTGEDRLGIFIDEESELVQGDEGEALFDDNGEPTQYLQNRQKMLSDLANSEIITKRFIEKVVELDLLDEFEVRVVYQSGQQRNVTGVYTISEQKLLDLDKEVLADFHKQNYLGACYALMLSLGQLSRLVELSNKTDNPMQGMQIMRPGEKPEQAANGEAAS